MATALTVRKFLISETLAFIAFIPSSLDPLNPLYQFFMRLHRMRSPWRPP